MRIRRRDVFHAPKRTELPIVYHGGFAEHVWTPSDSWEFVKVARSSQHWCDLLCILLLRGVTGKLTAVINLTDWRFSLFRKFGNSDVSMIARVRMLRSSSVRGWLSHEQSVVPLQEVLQERSQAR